MAQLVSGFKCRVCGATLPVEFDRTIRKLIRVKCERCGEWNSVVELRTVPSAKESMRKR